MNEIEYALSRLEKAHGRLKEAVNIAKDELERDGVIQRFEFTFEQLWKTIKIILNNKGIDVKTPRDSLKEAFRLDWLDNEEVFLDMLEDRNKSSHIYEQKTAEEIFDNIKNQYESAIGKVIEKLKKHR